MLVIKTLAEWPPDLWPRGQGVGSGTRTPDKLIERVKYCSIIKPSGHNHIMVSVLETQTHNHSCNGFLSWTISVNTVMIFVRKANTWEIIHICVFLFYWVCTASPGFLNCFTRYLEESGDHPRVCQLYRMTIKRVVWTWKLHRIYCEHLETLIPPDMKLCLWFIDSNENQTFGF